MKHHHRHQGHGPIHHPLFKKKKKIEYKHLKRAKDFFLSIQYSTVRYMHYAV